MHHSVAAGRHRVPWYFSLRVRLLTVSVVVALCSVTATAWLATATTTTALQHQQGQLLSADASVYDTLLGYAATHRSWSGVTSKVRQLAVRTGQRIVLATQDRQVIASSGRAAGTLPAAPSAIVDPLNVTGVMAPAGRDAPQDGIDPRVVGPFLLSSAERRVLAGLAAKVTSCLRRDGYSASVAAGPSGRPVLTVTDPPKPAWPLICQVERLYRPLPSEQRALSQLATLVNGCLSRQHQQPVVLRFGVSGIRWLRNSDPQPASGVAVIQTCIAASRREQLRPYAAPPALLFITDAADQEPASTLTAASRLRIVEISALVLAVTVLVTVGTASRLTRPLRRLTEAARDPGPRLALVPVTSRDELGQLTAAFNELTERRERAEAQREAMISDIAHELRTPLGNIRGWLEAVEDGVADPDAALNSSLLEEALQLQRIIDDLRDLAAADAGRFRLRLEPTRLDELLRQVVSAQRARAEAVDVRLTVRVPDCADLGADLNADPVRLRQAVGNLVANAIRHTPPGGEVTVTYRRTGSHFIIEVIDTGSGISAEDLPLIFDRFWRADKSRSRRTGGSGLGLPITRQLVEAHGGYVTAASTPGQGSVFTIWLPGGSPLRWAAEAPVSRTHACRHPGPPPRSRM